MEIATAASPSSSALFLSFSGLTIDAKGRELNYDFLGSGVFDWSDIWHALVFGLQAMTLRLPSYVDFSTWGARWFMVVPHFLLTVTLVPLFLLALRRRFRR